MNENLYIAHKKKLPHKTLRVHSARYTQCIHVSSRKLKLPKDMHSIIILVSELRSCVKVEVAVLDSLSLIFRTVFVNVQQH